MKHLLLVLLSFHTLYAAPVPVHNASLYFAILFLILLIISIYAFFVRKCEEKNQLLQEKEKELIALHQALASSEKESIQLLSQKEKEILTLKHTISDLERKIADGTKNQVVSKIEALQKKRRLKQSESSKK